jgi:catalase (peroxidase I)
MICFTISLPFLGIFLLFQCCSSFVLNETMVASIKADLTTSFNLFPSYGLQCDARASPCNIGDAMGGILRLVFHDAAGEGGGINGCIDLNEPAHNGLQETLSILNTLYNSAGYSSLITKADLIVLAGITVIEFASAVGVTNDELILTGMDTPPHILSLPFRYGRKDADSCNDIGLLPSAGLSYSQLLNLFSSRFGMNDADIVAIMGSHSLGRAESSNSGFEGGWHVFQSSFSNNYYRTFFDTHWTSFDVSSNFWQSAL